jgi:hypothetical protein
VYLRELFKEEAVPRHGLPCACLAEYLRAYVPKVLTITATEMSAPPMPPTAAFMASTAIQLELLYRVDGKLIQVRGVGPGVKQKNARDADEERQRRFFLGLRTSSAT